MGCMAIQLQELVLYANFNVQLAEFHRHLGYFSVFHVRTSELIHHWDAIVLLDIIQRIIYRGASLAIINAVHVIHFRQAPQAVRHVEVADCR
jgi:hypothetical protein